MCNPKPANIRKESWFSVKTFHMFLNNFEHNWNNRGQWFGATSLWSYNKSKTNRVVFVHFWYSIHDRKWYLKDKTFLYKAVHEPLFFSYDKGFQTGFGFLFWKNKFKIHLSHNAGIPICSGFFVYFHFPQFLAWEVNKPIIAWDCLGKDGFLDFSQLPS